MLKKKTTIFKRALLAFLIFITSTYGYNNTFATGESVSTSIPESYKNYVVYYTSNPSLFAYVTVYNFFSKKANNPATFVKWYGDKGYKQCGSRAASSDEVTKCFLKMSNLGNNRHMDTVPSVTASNMASVIGGMVKEMNKQKVYILTNSNLWAVFWRATARKTADGGYDDIKFCGVAAKRGKNYKYRCIDAKKVVAAARGSTRIKIGR